MVPRSQVSQSCVPLASASPLSPAVQSAVLSQTLQAAAAAVTVAAQAAQAAAEAARAASVAAQLCSQVCAASATASRQASQASQASPPVQSAATTEFKTASAETMPLLVPSNKEQKSSYTAGTIKKAQSAPARPVPFKPRPAVVTGQAFRRPTAAGDPLGARLASPPNKSSRQERERTSSKPPHDSSVYDAMYGMPSPQPPSERPEINRALVVFLALLIAGIVTFAVFLLHA